MPWSGANRPMTETDDMLSGSAASGESLADDQFPPRRPPCLIGEIANRVTGERQQVQGRQHGGKMLLAVPEIVLQVVTLGLQRVEGLVLDLPSGPSRRGHGGDIVAMHGQVGDKAVVICDNTLGIAYLDTEPIDLNGLFVAAQRHIVQPPVAVCHAFLTDPDRFAQRFRHDPGQEVLDRRMRVRLADEQEMPALIQHSLAYRNVSTTLIQPGS